LTLAVQTRAGLVAIVGDVQHHQPIGLPRHESFVRHPIRATVEDATHIRQVAARGESPATPAILVGVVLAFVVPLTAIIMLLAFGIAYFS
jgi:hypothetical protein